MFKEESGFAQGHRPPLQPFLASRGGERNKESFEILGRKKQRTPGVYDFLYNKHSSCFYLGGGLSQEAARVPNSGCRGEWSEGMLGRTG